MVRAGGYFAFFGGTEAKNDRYSITREMTGNA